MSEDRLLPGTAEPLADLLLRQLHERAGLTSILRRTGPELGRRYGSQETIFVVRSSVRANGYLWRCSQSPGDGDSSLGYFEPPAAVLQKYFSGPEGDWLITGSTNDPGAHAWRLHRAEGGPVDPPSSVIDHARFVAGRRPLSRLVSVLIPAVGDSVARLFLVNPSVDENESMLCAIVRLAREVGPSLLLRHERRIMRAQIQSEERALLARELHDGVIQALHALRIRIHVLKRQAGFTAPAGDLGQIEDELHQQLIALRELTEVLRPFDVEPAQLLDHVRSLVERFRRDTRIAITFAADVQEMGLNVSTCREVVRVVQEALTNIRRHSGASSAQVRITGLNHQWLIEISDDGKGFPFSGRLTLEDLDRTLQGPRVIKERVRALGGDLIIDSGTWRGTRLQIRIPLSTGYAVA